MKRTHFQRDAKKNLIVDVLQKPNGENGKVYEAHVYAWLEKHYICYTSQVHIKQANCFKESNQGYDADGIIENNVIFDVKQFGPALPHIETLRRKIQAKILARMCVENDYMLADETKEAIKEYLSEVVSKKDNNFANGRMVRNLYDDLVMNHARRISRVEDPDKEQLSLLLKEDFNCFLSL